MSFCQASSLLRHEKIVQMIAEDLRKAGNYVVNERLFLLRSANSLSRIRLRQDIVFVTDEGKVRIADVTIPYESTNPVL